MDELSLKSVKPPPWGVSRLDAIPSCPIRTVRLPAVCWTYVLPSSDKVGLLKLILTWFLRNLPKANFLLDHPHFIP